MSTELLAPYITINEVAQRLKVSETRVRQLIEQKKLTAARVIGGYRVITYDSFQRLAQSRHRS